jgi:hypothetical protein
LFRLQQPGADRIQVNVIADRPRIAIAAAIHDERLVTAAERVAEEFVPPIEPRRAGAEKPFHARDEVGIGCLDDEMKMIPHQTIRVNLPTGFGAGFGESGEKLLVIQIIAEDRLTAVATVHDVVNGAGIFDAQRAEFREQDFRRARP